MKTTKSKLINGFAVDEKGNLVFGFHVHLPILDTIIQGCGICSRRFRVIDYPKHQSECPAMNLWKKHLLMVQDISIRLSSARNLELAFPHH